MKKLRQSSRWLVYGMLSLCILIILLLCFYPRVSEPPALDVAAVVTGYWEEGDSASRQYEAKRYRVTAMVAEEPKRTEINTGEVVELILTAEAGEYPVWISAQFDPEWAVPLADCRVGDELTFDGDFSRYFALINCTLPEK